jgi:hypothetical protein
VDPPPGWGQHQDVGWKPPLIRSGIEQRLPFQRKRSRCRRSEFQRLTSHHRHPNAVPGEFAGADRLINAHSGWQECGDCWTQSHAGRGGVHKTALQVSVRNRVVHGSPCSAGGRTGDVTADLDHDLCDDAVGDRDFPVLGYVFLTLDVRRPSLPSTPSIAGPSFPVRCAINACNSLRVSCDVNTREP